MNRAEIKNRARCILDPLVVALAGLGVPPTLVTLIGTAIALYGASLIIDGSFPAAGALLLVAGLCDVLDGDLARRRGTTSEFGAFIDSTLDRVVEFAYYGGIILYLVERSGGFHNFDVAVTLTALTSSVLTSYTRARAEGLGVECRVGILERPERIALLALGLFLGYRVLMALLTAIAVAATVSFLQRIYHVHHELRRR